MPSTIVFYISGHGFGHASRSIEVINALVDRATGSRVVVRSRSRLAGDAHRAPGVRLEPVECDTGVVQIDSLHLDERESTRRVRGPSWPASTTRRRGDRVAEEPAQASLVVADLPALGIAAAHAAGVPAIALGNFTWDWIYSGLRRQRRTSSM